MPPQQISPSAASRSPNAFGDVARLAERLARSSSCCRAGPWPTRRGSRRNRSGRRRTCECPSSRSVLPISQAFRTCVTNCWRSVGVAHRRAAAGRRPHRRDQRADRPGRRARMRSARRFSSSSVAVDADVRIEQKQIDAVELDAVHRCVGGEIEHRVEIDRRLGVRSLADQPRPHRVVEGGKPVRGTRRSCADL